ncbi:S1C family serine protease [Phenylobacterium sp.]|jgi:S1-C subfamily serine protease|uniref:S1C family serine protease n=1 Tax=Phenylobacterium sp. TaxID=1871053 RepID=UPI002F9330E9
MKLVRMGAGLAAAFALASYAQAADPEPRFGGRADLPGAAPAEGAPKAPLGQLRTGGSVAYGKALSRLRPERQGATRGAAETRVYQRASPAVVLIVTRGGLGSGVLISADGKIVTNHHVVGDAEEVGVIFKPAQEGASVGEADVRRGKVLRRDDVTDLALVQVSEVPAGVTPLQIGNSTTVQVGADVHAIGHPTGEAWTYTRGIVSQIRRAYAWKAQGLQHEATVIQTQTPINPGNSGGPLLDENLNVVGINSFVSDGEGLNFAVSAEDVKSFLARSEDRLTATAARKAACKEGVVLKEEPSTKPKGISQLLDTNCDGRGDALLIAPTSRRDATVLWKDTDDDGELDAMFFDDNHDGYPEQALYDTDGNGKPDMKGDFRKGELEPYRWEKIAET